MDWMVGHALLVGCLLAAAVTLIGEALSVNRGVIGLALMGVVAFVSYLTVEEISRRDYDRQ